MFRYLILRLWLLAVTQVGVSLLIFVILQILPWDAVDVLLLNWTSDTGAEFETLRKQLGLDRPWYEQYFGWLWDAMRGDLGRSFSMVAPVAPIVMQRLFFSLRLAIPALLIAVVLSLVLGVIAAVRPNGWVDSAITVCTLTGVSVPAFISGSLFITDLRGLARLVPPPPPRSARARGSSTGPTCWPRGHRLPAPDPAVRPAARALRPRRIHG